MESGIHRMKVAVGFDLAGLVLWFITASVGTWLFFSERRKSFDPSRTTQERKWHGEGLPDLPESFREGSMSSRSFRGH
jgi:hypothetical protein